MLKSLIAFSVRNAPLVLVLAALLVVAAVLEMRRVPVDVFPELNAPTVLVLTEAGGLAADEVEQYVTFPIESSLNGLPGVRRVRSASSIGLSLVWVEFDWGEEIFRARQLVSQRIDAVRERLPAEAHAALAPITSITGEIMLLAVSSPDGSVGDLDLRGWAEFELRPLLLAVPGVAQVVAIGGELPEYQVHVRQDRLLLHGLAIEDVVEAAREAHSTASAGYLPDVEHRELPIRQSAQVRSVEDIRAAIVDFRDGVAVTIGDVADVRIGGAPRRGAASDGAAPAVVLSVQKSPGTNTLALTGEVDRVLNRVQASMPAGISLNRHAFRQADFIERSISNVVVVLRDATIIVCVVLVLFLLNVRTTIITLAALPLSLAAALLALSGLGLTINVMTLGGLAVAVGVLVDDAIIDVENVHRRQRQNLARPAAERRPLPEVIFEASNEIRPAMVFATVIIVMVFVPLLFLEGIEGRFFRPLGITYIVSILASLLVALTVTPALCRHLLGGRLGVADGAGPAPRESGHLDGLLVRGLKRVYEPALRVALRHRMAVVLAAGLATAAALWLGSTFGRSFLPQFNEGTFTVFLMAPPGTSLAESDRLARGVERRMLELEGVRSVTRRTGRAERDEHAEPVSSSEIEVTLATEADAARVRRGIDGILAQIPGITTMVGQPMEHRLSHILSGTPAAIAISIFGEDLTVLRRVAREVETALRGLEGTRDVAANREVMITSLPIRYRHADLAAAGLTPAMAARQVQTALYGALVAEVNQGTRRYGLVVRLDPLDRERIDQVRSLILAGRDGALVRLSEVADIGPELTSNLIARENGRRRAIVSCNVAEGHNLGDLIEAVRAKVDPIVAQAGCIAAYGGQFEAQQSASRVIVVLGSVVLVAMLLLLHLSTGSLRAALLVMVNLPLGLIGGILAVYISESPSVVGNTMALLGLGSRSYQAPVVSIASMVGFVTLFGIAVRNGILLLNHYAHLLRDEGCSREDAILRGSLERLSPILMTALCSALGLVPLALAAGRPGSELLAPLAMVVLGGLISSTLLNLFVIPAGYSLVFRSDPLPRHRSLPASESAAIPSSTALSIPKGS